MITGKTGHLQCAQQLITDLQYGAHEPVKMSGESDTACQSQQGDIIERVV